MYIRITRSRLIGALAFLLLLFSVLLALVDSTNAQQPVQPNSQFPMTDVEKAKLDSLQWQVRYLNLQYQMQTQQLQSEISKYVDDTLKAHGNPSGWSLNQQTMSWVNTPEPPKPTGTPPAAKQPAKPDAVGSGANANGEGKAERQPAPQKK